MCSIIRMIIFNNGRLMFYNSTRYHNIVLNPFHNIVFIFILGVSKYIFISIFNFTFFVICLEKPCPIIYLLLEFCFFLCLFNQNVTTNATNYSPFSLLKSSFFILPSSQDIVPISIFGVPKYSSHFHI